MTNLAPFSRNAGIAALLALSASVAHAGDDERARAAIASALAKIETAARLPASGQSGDFQTQARNALDKAERALKKGQEEAALSDANRAGEFADLAVGASSRNTAAAEADATAVADAAVAQAGAAEAQAAAADARAASAEQAAAASAAEAAALRNATPPAPPAPPVTTVATVETTQTRAATSTPRRAKPRTTVRTSTAVPAVTEKTTTTVTTTPQ